MLLLCSVLIGTGFVIALNQLHFKINSFGYLINALPTVIGSLVYLYVKYSLLFKSKFRWIDLIHFSPFIVAFIIGFYESNNITLNSVLLNIGLKVLVSIAYFILSLKLLEKHRKNVEDHFSQIENIDLKWLSFIVKIGLGTYLIYLSLMILWSLNLTELEHIDSYPNFIVLFFILPISYYSLNSPLVFSQLNNYVSQGLLDASEEEISKIEVKELVSSEKAHELFIKLEHRIIEKELFCIENLTLEDLAKEIEVHSKYLSYIINSQSGKNFFDFINSFRVKEFNKRVLDERNKSLTFLAIAFDCGFNSKSAFNRSYKNEMGITPTEFIKQHSKNNQ